MKADIRLKWKVSEVPTGQWRSFEKRGWPFATYPDGSPAAYITCDDEYVPANIKTGNYGELTVMVADWQNKDDGDRCFSWRQAQRKVTTLGKAKALAAMIILQNREFIPEGALDKGPKRL